MSEPHADEEGDLTPPSAFLSVPPGPGGDRGPGPPRLASGSQPLVLLVGGTAAPPLQLGTPEPGAQSALLFALLSAKSSIPTRLGGRGARTARPTPQTWPWRPAEQGVVGRAPGCLRLRSAASPPHRFVTQDPAPCALAGTLSEPTAPASWALKNLSVSKLKDGRWARRSPGALASPGR